jgi:hypothetical protein
MCMLSLFYQLPNCNLFTQHVIYLYGETPLVNYGPRSILLHSYYRLLYSSIIYFLANKYLYHTIRLILCFQQTGEIGSLTASWGKVSWLCCVHVPRCCWRCTSLLAPLQSQLAKPSGIGSFSYWSIKLWFHTWGKTYCCAFHTLLLGFPTGSSTPTHHWVIQTCRMLQLKMAVIKWQ